MRMIYGVRPDLSVLIRAACILSACSSVGVEAASPIPSSVPSPPTVNCVGPRGCAPVVPRAPLSTSPAIVNVIRSPAPPPVRLPPAAATTATPLIPQQTAAQRNAALKAAGLTPVQHQGVINGTGYTVPNKPTLSAAATSTSGRYTFQTTPYGTIQVSQNGKVISTTTPQNATLAYGYRAPAKPIPGPATATSQSVGALARTPATASVSYGSIPSIAATQGIPVPSYSSQGIGQPRPIVPSNPIGVTTAISATRSNAPAIVSPLGSAPFQSAGITATTIPQQTPAQRAAALQAAGLTPVQQQGVINGAGYAPTPSSSSTNPQTLSTVPISNTMAGTTPATITSKQPIVSPLGGGTAPSHSSITSIPLSASAYSSPTAAAGLSYPTLSQLNTSQSVYGTLNATGIKGQTCLAVDYVMIARAAGDKTATVGQFWSGTDGATTSGFSSIPNHTISISSTTVKLDSASANGQLAVARALNSGPVLIRGSIKSSSAPGGVEQHWMLGVGTSTDSQGGAAVVANDPWSGTQVKVDARTGKVVDVLNPSTGGYQPLQSAADSNPSKFGALTTFESGNVNSAVFKTVAIQ